MRQNSTLQVSALAVFFLAGASSSLALGAIGGSSGPLPKPPQTLIQDMPSASPTPGTMGGKDMDQVGSVSGTTTSGTEGSESGRIKSTSSYDNLGGGADSDLSTTGKEPSETRGTVKPAGSNQ